VLDGGNSLTKEGKEGHEGEKSAMDTRSKGEMIVPSVGMKALGKRTRSIKTHSMEGLKGGTEEDGGGKKEGIRPKKKKYSRPASA